MTNHIASVVVCLFVWLLIFLFLTLSLTSCSPPLLCVVLQAPLSPSRAAELVFTGRVGQIEQLFILQLESLEAEGWVLASWKQQFNTFSVPSSRLCLVLIHPSLSLMSSVSPPSTVSKSVLTNTVIFCRPLHLPIVSGQGERSDAGYHSNTNSSLRWHLQIIRTVTFCTSPVSLSPGTVVEFMLCHSVSVLLCSQCGASSSLHSKNRIFWFFLRQRMNWI